MARPPSTSTATSIADDELDALLARGRLAGGARDAILARVLAGVRAQEPPKARAIWPQRLVFGLAGLAAVAVAVVLVPARLHAPDALRAKGAPAAGVVLDIGCEGGTLDACPAGSKLVFGVSGEVDGFLAAYAEPRGGGERVWYFSADGESPRVHAEGGTTAVRRAIRIGREHGVGDYVVHLVLTRAPLARAALLAGPVPSEVIAESALVVHVVPPAPQPEGALDGAR